MTAELGLRERKKQRTRAAIIEAAARLFAERGYDETTVAEIAAAVEISPRTFFSYFPSKEDVLFADTAARIQAAQDAITSRRPGERMVDVLLRAVREVFGSTAFTDDLGGPMGPVRLRLAASVPAVQAGALRQLVAAQGVIATALHRAYPDQLTETDAAAVSGALVGSLTATTMAGLRNRHTVAELQTDLRRAAEIATNGIANLT